MSKAAEDGVDRSEYFRRLFVAAFDAWQQEATGSFGDDWKIRPNPPLPTATPLKDICWAERSRFGREGVTLAGVNAALGGSTPLDELRESHNLLREFAEADLNAHDVNTDTWSCCGHHINFDDIGDTAAHYDTCKRKRARALLGMPP